MGVRESWHGGEMMVIWGGGESLLIFKWWWQWGEPCSFSESQNFLHKTRVYKSWQALLKFPNAWNSIHAVLEARSIELSEKVQ